MAAKDFPDVFAQLKAILKKYEARLVVTQDGAHGYSLNTPYSAAYKKEVFFGAVQINKNYVSYHLMPVYVYPDLLDGISDGLKKRMQGKSCFNFTASDAQLFTELAGLTERGIERFREQGLR
jgi:hypothetical protein